MPWSTMLITNLAVRLTGDHRREKRRDPGNQYLSVLCPLLNLCFTAGTHTPLLYLIAQAISSFTEEEMKIRKLKSRTWDYKSCSLLRAHLPLRSYWQLTAFGRGQVSFFRGVAPGRLPTLQWVALPWTQDSVDCIVGYKGWEEDMVGESGRRCRGRAGCEQNTWYVCMKFSDKICLKDHFKRRVEMVHIRGKKTWEIWNLHFQQIS